MHPAAAIERVVDFVDVVDHLAVHVAALRAVLAVRCRNQPMTVHVFVFHFIAVLDEPAILWHRRIRLHQAVDHVHDQFLDLGVSFLRQHEDDAPLLRHVAVVVLVARRGAEEWIRRTRTFDADEGVAIGVLIQSAVLYFFHKAEFCHFSLPHGLRFHGLNGPHRPSKTPSSGDS